MLTYAKLRLLYPVSRIVTNDVVYLDLRWVAPSDRSEVVASPPPPAGFGGRPLGRDAPSCFTGCKTHFKEQLPLCFYGVGVLCYIGEGVNFTR